MYEALSFVKNAKDEWDQFKTNEQKFGYVKSTINEDVYTIPLDRNSDFYQSRIEDADTLSKEILASSYSRPNLHLAEERGHDVFSCDNKDEETAYSSVTKITTRSSGSYVPPAFRNKTSPDVKYRQQEYKELPASQNGLRDQNSTLENIEKLNYSEALETLENYSSKSCTYTSELSTNVLTESSPICISSELPEKGPIKTSHLNESTKTHHINISSEKVVLNNDSHLNQNLALDSSSLDKNETIPPKSITLNINAPEFHPRGLSATNSGFIPNPYYSSSYYTPYGIDPSYATIPYYYPPNPYSNIVYYPSDNNMYYGKHASSESFIAPSPLDNNYPTTTQPANPKIP